LAVDCRNDHIVRGIKGGTSIAWQVPCFLYCLSNVIFSQQLVQAAGIYTPLQSMDVGELGSTDIGSHVRSFAVTHRPNTAVRDWLYIMSA